MPITIHQALHGYAEGHRQIACSAPLTAKDARTLLVLSDSSGPGVVSLGVPYLTGYPLVDSGLYALGMTWPAPEMSRPGCVWTHTLLISFADLATVESPSTIAGLFRTHSEQPVRAFGVDLQAAFSFVGGLPLDEAATQCFAEVAGALYGHPTQQIWLRRPIGTDVDSVVLRVWDQQWPRLRRTFKFCTLTSKDRSQDAVQFDLQLTTGSSSRLSFASRRAGMEASSSAAIPWLVDLIEDARSGQRSSLRKHLRLVGTDLLGGREHMQPICALHAALSRSGSHSLRVAVALSSQPPLSESKLAKTAVVRRALSDSSAEEDRETLAFILKHFDLLDEQERSEHAARLASVAWRSDPRGFMAAIGTAGTATASALREGLAGVSIDAVLTALPFMADLAEQLLQLFPHLAERPLFWAEAEETLTLLGSGEVDLANAKVVDAVIGGVTLEATIAAAAQRLPTTLVLDSVLRLLGTSVLPPAGSLWVKYACSNVDGIASFLSVRSARPAVLLQMLAQSVPPDALPNDYGEDPWLVALSSLREAEGRLPLELAAYGFRRALGWRSRSVASLLRLTFEPLHDATLKEGVAASWWAILEDALPWVSSSAAWDHGLRLRMAVARRCADLPLGSDQFVELVGSDRLFSDLVDAVWPLWNGLRYLRAIKDDLRGTFSNLATRRREEIKRVIKERSSFWR